MSNAKIDVLLPYWGDFSLLEIAIKSVLSQTEQDWRLLIIDDHYPSTQALEKYGNHSDKRIQYTRHAKNVGLVKNFNYAVDQTQANYSVIFGCDDIMLPTYLETALNNIGDADYYQPGVSIIDDEGTVYMPNADRIKKLLRPRKTGIVSGESIVASLCHGNWLYFPSITWKSETLRRYRFDETRPNTQDISTEINILKDGGSLFLDNTITFHYRRSSNSFSSKAKSGTRFNEETATYKKFAQDFDEIGWKKAALAARLHLTSRIHNIMS